MKNNGRSMTELAAQAGVGGSYFTRILRLGFLAPAIVEAILAGRQPLELTAAKLTGDTACRPPGTTRRPGSGSTDRPSRSGPPGQRPPGRAAVPCIARRRRQGSGTAKCPAGDFRARGRCVTAPVRSLLSAPGSFRRRPPRSRGPDGPVRNRPWGPPEWIARNDPFRPVKGPFTGLARHIPPDRSRPLPCPQGSSPPSRKP